MSGSSSLRDRINTKREMGTTHGDKKPQQKNKGGRPQKKKEELLKVKFPVGLTEEEYKGVEEKANAMSDEMMMKISVSAYIRMLVLQDLKKPKRK